MGIQTDLKRSTLIIIIAGVIVVLGGGYLIWTWMKTTTHSGNTQLTGMNVRGRGEATTETPQYRKVLNEYNTERAANAEANDQSYMSVMSENTEKPNAQPSKASEQSQKPTQVNYYYQAPQAQQQVRPRNKEYDKQVSEQVKGIMEGWGEKSHSTATIADEESYSKSVANASYTTASSQPVSSGRDGIATGKSAAVIIPGFTLASAILKTEIDTDENSMVKAEIVGGPYDGAQCFAMGYKRLNETVDMTFTYMQWKGKAYKITAKAVDPDSMRTALSGEVNHRYFQRIILPALALAVGKTGRLYEQASAQNIITSDGALIQTYPETPSGKAVAGTIAGGIGQQAGQVLATDAANMPQKQVVRALGSTIGIQFVGPVVTTDELAKDAIQANQQAEMNTLAQPAGQPQQQYRLPQNQNGGYSQGPGAYNGYPGYTPGLGQPGMYQTPRY